jgi:adenosylhomocysteine nucleosidase
MKIGVVVAMQREFAPFIEGKTYDVTTVGVYCVYSVSHSGHTLFCVCQPHTGIIPAASATQMLISRFGVEMLINFGVVGALTEEFSLCSTVLLGSVVHYELDTYHIDGTPRGRYLCFDDIPIPTDEKLRDLALSVSPNLTVARCASGNRFIENAADKRQLHDEFAADVCDMESAGILVTAKFNNVPCLLIKTVSDSLTGGGGEYYANLDKAVAAYIGLIHEILNKI